VLTPLIDTPPSNLVGVLVLLLGELFSHPPSGNVEFEPLWMHLKHTHTHIYFTVMRVGAGCRSLASTRPTLTTLSTVLVLHVDMMVGASPVWLLVSIPGLDFIVHFHDQHPKVSGVYGSEQGGVGGCSCDPLLYTSIPGYILSGLRSARFCVGCSYGSLHLLFHIWPRLDGAHSCYLLITVDVEST